MKTKSGICHRFNGKNNKHQQISFMSLCFYDLTVLSSVLNASIFVFDRFKNLQRKIVLPSNQPKPAPHDWLLYTLEVISQNYALSGRCIIYTDTELYPSDAAPPSKLIKQLIEVGLKNNKIELVDDSTKFPIWVLEIFSE